MVKKWSEQTSACEGEQKHTINQKKNGDIMNDLNFRISN